MEETHQVVVRAIWQPLSLIRYGGVYVLSDLSAYTVPGINSRPELELLLQNRFVRMSATQYKMCIGLDEYHVWGILQRNP